MELHLYVGGLLSVIIMIILAKNIRIVRTGKAVVVERLGVYSATWNTGLHFKVPFIEREVRVVSLAEEILQIPSEEIITKEDIAVTHHGATVYWSVVNPQLFTYGTKDPEAALKDLAATNLRNLIRNTEAEQLVDGGENRLRRTLHENLQQKAKRWGIKIRQIDLTLSTATFP